MPNIFKKTWWLMILGIILCFINIDRTYLLIEDTARDSVRIIQIWQDKELTLIGPPASLGQRSVREFYLGSLSYYLGILGLAATNFEVWGAVLGQVLIFVSSIPILYLLLEDYLKVKNPILGTLIYVISPLTLTHMRFYWNPNAIIGLSTWFWFLTLKKKSKIFEQILSGILLGLIFNFHYFAVIPIFFWLIYLIFQKKIRKTFLTFAGFVVGASPIWIFELRNKFFLTKTLLFNLGNLTSNKFSLVHLAESLYRFPLAILGIKPLEIVYPALFEPTLQMIFGILLILAIVFACLRSNTRERFLFILAIISSIVTGLVSGGSFFGRYIFGLYPIFIWIVIKAFEKISWIWVILIPIMLITDYKIISFRPEANINYVGIDILEEASLLIKSDVKNETYNLSENIYGDAQARGLRYFVLKNVEKKPENEISYEHLDSLYVLTPNLEKTIKDNRYEYYAPNLTKIAWVKDLGELKLYKFSKED